MFGNIFKHYSIDSRGLILPFVFLYVNILDFFPCLLRYCFVSRQITLEYLGVGGREVGITLSTHWMGHHHLALLWRSLGHGLLIGSRHTSTTPWRALGHGLLVGSRRLLEARRRRSPPRKEGQSATQSWLGPLPRSCLRHHRLLSHVSTAVN